MELTFNATIAVIPQIKANNQNEATQIAYEITQLLAEKYGAANLMYVELAETENIQP